MQAGRTRPQPAPRGVRPPHPCQTPAMLANRSMPSCTVIPELDYDGMVEAVDWLCAVFGFTERWRAEGHCAQLSVGDGAVVVEQRQSGERLADRVRGSHSTMVRIENAARHSERARGGGGGGGGGARIVAEPVDQPYAPPAGRAPGR